MAFQLHYTNDTEVRAPRTLAELVARRLPSVPKAAAATPRSVEPAVVGDLRRPMFVKLDGMDVDQLRVELAAAKPGSFHREVIVKKLREFEQ